IVRGTCCSEPAACEAGRVKAWDEEAWARALATVARSRGWPAADDAARLGALVRAVAGAGKEGSARGGAARGAGSADAMAARLGFSFVRDVPKAHAAVRELVGTGALAIPADRALRVLDVGAGLGATTWGVVRALAEAGMRGDVEAAWIDEDASALEIAQ